ncbi:hypothetical protein OEG84_19195 [Hoeflea sp. G2-23]|uniref:Uncharacterized protein n=1 Tax=Hoeflea algicola TaxID=2983763 RepID=A0ABT3ZDG0_9HYPH|nr:hypothetical protein [Hoeflea algicola]MCY0149774.1 hypothetical protein [Hoeflea algicola]
MPDDLDETFGVLRGAERIEEWENGRSPLSLSSLDTELAQRLAELSRIVQSNLLKPAARTQSYIWAVTEDGSIKISVEELSIRQPEATFSGYPRRRGYKHPSEDKKLGHPTLLDGQKARIAGELAFDEKEGGLHWVLNASSGRYCRHMPPSEKQIQNVAARFLELGVDVSVDLD